MQGVGVHGVPVAGGKVNTHREVDLAPAHHVVKETVHLDTLQGEGGGEEGFWI